MTIMEMLGQSGVLTLLGMGVVFGFLVILVISVIIMGKVISAFSSGKGADAAQASGTTAGVSAPSGQANAGVTAAISAAVNEYRKNS